jgi:hypothetical protein
MGGSLEAPHEAPQFSSEGEGGSQRKRREYPPFPPGCPVKPLGLTANIEGSQRCYYLDATGQLVGLEAGNRHGKNALAAMFGEQMGWLEDSFPQWSKPIYEGRGASRVMVKDSEIIGFDQADASEAMIIECTRKGMFDPAGRLRGRGAHPLPHDGIVIHHGDQLLHARQRVDGAVRGWEWLDCGLYEGHVYPASEPTPRPWGEPSNARPAEKLLELLFTWRWKRPLLDARFMLGWIGAAMIGGALRWRPNIWLTGSAGTGKSTLNGERGVLDLLFGAGLLRTGNASAAAIRQKLKNSTVPVLFDEIEASADNRRVQEVVELARVSSSGATIHRGGADHQAHEFTLRSCFQFSSVNIPPLQPQDRSRLGILELEPFAKGAAAPVLEDWNLPEIGRKLQRRMLDGWSRFPATLAAFQAALSGAGHSRRACDQFGVLLACADLLLNEHQADDEEIAEWAGLCAPDRMAEISEATPDHEACMNHLLTHMVQARGGDEREALASWIGRAVQLAATETLVGDEDLALERAHGRLAQLGIRLVNASRRAASDREGLWGAVAFRPADPGFLAVAANHQALGSIYGGTTWQGGVWRQSLARTPGALGHVRLKFGRVSLRAVLVPLAAVLDDSELPDASKPEAAAAWLAEQMKEAEA